VNDYRVARLQIDKLDDSKLNAEVFLAVTEPILDLQVHGDSMVILHAKSIGIYEKTSTKSFWNARHVSIPFRGTRHALHSLGNSSRVDETQLYTTVLANGCSLIHHVISNYWVSGYHIGRCKSSDCRIEHSQFKNVRKRI
jgi:hypothetical protein